MNNEIFLVEPNNQISSHAAKLERLAKTTKQVASNRRALNTHNGYASDWDDFANWCKEHCFQSLPAEPHVIAAFLSDRAVNRWVGASGRFRKPVEKAPLKLNTLLRRVWGIKAMHEESGFHLDTSHKEIKYILDSLRRSNTQKEHRQDPLLLDDVRKMCEGLQVYIKNKEQDSVKALIATRDKALLLIGFVSAMRRSEIAALTMQDVRIVEEGIELHIMQSKTGERKPIIPYGSNPLSCPVRALKAWVSEASISEGPIFRPINKHGQVSQNPLSGYAIALIVQRNEYVKSRISSAIQNGDYVPSYAGHSLRAGFITTAAKQDVPEHLIMEQTGHKKSDTLKKYIREANKWENNAATRIGL